MTGPLGPDTDDDSPDTDAERAHQSPNTDEVAPRPGSALRHQVVAGGK